MSRKGTLENACLDSGLFAFVGAVGRLEGTSVARTHYVRIYRASEAPIRQDGEPEFSRALFIGTAADATRFACAQAALACAARMERYRAEGEEHNAAVSAHFAERYRALSVRPT